MAPVTYLVRILKVHVNIHSLRCCHSSHDAVPHLTVKLADKGTQSQGTSHISVAANARNSINQYVTDIHSQVQSEGQSTAAEF